MKRRQYSKEFKLNVIQQCYLHDNIRELASELGVRPALIYKWRAAYEGRKSTQRPTFPGNGKVALSPEQQEK